MICGHSNLIQKFHLFFYFQTHHPRRALVVNFDSRFLGWRAERVLTSIVPSPHHCHAKTRVRCFWQRLFNWPPSDQSRSTLGGVRSILSIKHQSHTGTHLRHSSHPVRGSDQVNIYFPPETDFKFPFSLYGRADQLVALFTLLALQSNHGSVSLVYALASLASKETGLATLALLTFKQFVTGQRHHYKMVRTFVIQQREREYKRSPSAAENAI